MGWPVALPLVVIGGLVGRQDVSVLVHLHRSGYRESRTALRGAGFLGGSRQELCEGVYSIGEQLVFM